MPSGDATSNSNARPPWSKLSKPETGPNLIPSKYLPAGLLLSNPEKMSKATTERFYEHWWNRQQQKKLPLHFEVKGRKEDGGEEQEKQEGKEPEKDGDGEKMQHTDRDARGGGAHEWNCRRDRGAELQSEAAGSEATNHKTTPTTCTSCLLISQVSVSYALFVL